jgi:CheY-like chemotaxis protein
MCLVRTLIQYCGGCPPPVFSLFRMSADPTLLVAEDNENDVVLLRHAFLKAGIATPMTIARDGKEAIDCLKNCQITGEFPTLLLLDLHMPKYDGFEVLQWIRNQPGLRRLSVVIFTSSSLTADVNRAYDLGANSYLTKPIDTSSLADLMKTLHIYWVEFNKCPDCFSP